MSLAVTSSSARTSLARYSRSIGLWLLLLVAPVGARFMIGGRGATSSIVSVDGRVPWLTPEVLGMEVGVVIATLLLPVAFIYLRANVNKRQPWQTEEVTAGSRVAVAYGRWAADAAVMLAVLAATTAASWLLAAVLMPLGEVDLLRIAMPIWVIAAPPLVMMASLRVLFDARRWTRGWLGEVLFFFIWMGALVLAMAPMMGGKIVGGFMANMSDLTGFMSPMSYGRGGDGNFAIGGGDMTPGAAPIVLDVMGGLLAPGYLPARLAWLGVAALVPLLAGLIYAPHVAGKTRRAGRLLSFLQPGKARPANPNARPARAAALGWLNLLMAEVRLIAGGRLTLAAMAVVFAVGLAAPYSTGAGPAAMLLLVFALTAHAGRSEQGGLLALTRTGVQSPMARRVAFVVAGTLLALGMSAGAIGRGLAGGEVRVLAEALAMGAGTSVAAIGLGALTRSATAPRLVLLIAWYAYLSWGGG